MASQTDMRFRLDPVEWHLSPVPSDEEIVAESARVLALIGPRIAPVEVRVVRGPPEFDSRATKERITYGFPRGYARERAAVTIAHECAHVVASPTPDDETGHGEAWVRMFLCALDLAYGVVLLTPVSGPISELSGGIRNVLELAAQTPRPCELAIARRRPPLPKWRKRVR